MTTNNTEILAWEIADTVLYGDVMVVRLSDYDAMQSAYEEELFRVRQDRDTHSGTLVRAIEQIAEMEAECAKLRKDAERWRVISQKRELGKKCGCHCDLEEGMEPDGCVIDSGERHHCIYAKGIEVKEQCEYWRVIAKDSAMQEERTP